MEASSCHCQRSDAARTFLRPLLPPPHAASSAIVSDLDWLQGPAARSSIYNMTATTVLSTSTKRLRCRKVKWSRSARTGSQQTSMPGLYTLVHARVPDQGLELVYTPLYDANPRTQHDSQEIAVYFSLRRTQQLCTVASNTRGTGGKNGITEEQGSHTFDTLKVRPTCNYCPLGFISPLHQVPQVGNAVAHQPVYDPLPQWLLQIKNGLNL